VLKDKPHRREYFESDVYSAKWLVDSVKEGKLLDKDQYFAFRS